MAASLKQLLSFVDLLQKFRAIERMVYVKDSQRNENNVEHSYSLAMLAWYVVSTYGLKLDLDKVLRYALAHDLVEVHAGDTYIYGDAAHIASKEERERKAMLQLTEELSEFPDLHEAIAAYERREDPESKFVYALDKIDPILNIYRDNGRSWHRDGVTLEMIISTKTSKTAIDPTTKKIFEELLEQLRLEEEKLFPN